MIDVKNNIINKIDTEIYKDVRYHINSAELALQEIIRFIDPDDYIEARSKINKCFKCLSDAHKATRSQNKELNK